MKWVGHDEWSGVKNCDEMSDFDELDPSTFASARSVTAEAVEKEEGHIDGRRG